MLVEVDQASSPDADEDQYEAGLTKYPDPSALAPLCGEAEFDGLVDEMVADEAPRLFAVVQVYGKRADGRIAAWGMAFEDHAKVVGINNGTTMILHSPERAARRFSHHPNITARVVWVDHDTATSPDEIDAA